MSFVIEWRTRSIQRGWAIGSLVLAVLTLILTRSSIGWGTAFVAVFVLGVLYVIRRVNPARRHFWQFGVGGLAVLGAVLAWVLRTPIITALSATGELNYRLTIAREVVTLFRLHPLEGWGWIGEWHSNIAPYSLIGTGTGRPSTSAVDAYLDVLFQLGLVGLALFIGMAGLAFVRSWLLASRQRSVVYTWPAVVLASLLTSSLAESGILMEFGWMTLVVCCVLASQKLSWRRAFQRALEPENLD